MSETRTAPRVVIDKERCKGCELCIEPCPKDVLAMSTKINSKGYFYAEAFRPENCIGCALCAMSCPPMLVPKITPTRSASSSVVGFS